MKRVRGDASPINIEYIGNHKWRFRFDIVQEESGYSYYEQEYNHEPTIEEVRSLFINAIDLYDKSDSVNSFTVFGVKMWLDRGTRTSLAYTISVEESAGQENTTIWNEGEYPVPFTLPIVVMKGLLSALELYAKSTFNITQQHKSNVYNAGSIEELLSYDYKSGYPEKLVFNI